MTNRFLPVLAVLALGASGCASKKFVRNTVDPVSKQVGDLDKRSADSARAIEQLDEKTQREISRVGEKATSADSRAADASRQATEALTKTGQAIEKADNARTMAENSMNRTGQVERMLQNIDNFQVATTKVILFGFDKTTLTDDAKKELDDLSQSLSANKRYVIEVQGFTDSTGPADYNYALSEKRADTVVRYLTTTHKVPVYRIHTIGLGKAPAPEQAANRREARKMSRKVEVRVYVPSEMQTAEARTPSTTSATTTTPTTPATTEQDRALQQQREAEGQERQQPREQPARRP